MVCQAFVFAYTLFCAVITLCVLKYTLILVDILVLCNTLEVIVKLIPTKKGEYSSAYLPICSAMLMKRCENTDSWIASNSELAYLNPSCVILQREKICFKNIHYHITVCHAYLVHKLLQICIH